MIDEKKIEEAAREYEKKYSSICRKKEQRDKKNGALFSVWNISADVAFKDGAQWALEEFVKSLWHKAKEEPRNKASVLVIGGDNDDTIYYLTSDYQDWNHEVELWDINKWCYTSDLLPKEKGGNNE